MNELKRYDLTPKETQYLRNIAIEIDMANSKFQSALTMIAVQQELRNAKITPDLTALVEQPEQQQQGAPVALPDANAA